MTAGHRGNNLSDVCVCVCGGGGGGSGRQYQGRI